MGIISSRYDPFSLLLSMSQKATITSRIMTWKRTLLKFDREYSWQSPAIVFPMPDRRKRGKASAFPRLRLLTCKSVKHTPLHLITCLIRRHSIFKSVKHSPPHLWLLCHLLMLLYYWLGNLSISFCAFLIVFILYLIIILCKSMYCTRNKTSQQDVVAFLSVTYTKHYNLVLISLEYLSI